MIEDAYSKLEEMKTTAQKWKESPEFYDVDERHVWVIEDSIDYIQDAIKDLQYVISSAMNIKKIREIAEMISK